MQKAIGRLARGEILVRVERGEYHIQDDVFLEWLKHPPDSRAQTLGNAELHADEEDELDDFESD